MRPHAVAVIAFALATACTDLPMNMPTGPSTVAAAEVSPPLPGPGQVVRTEEWMLELEILELAGGSCPDDALRISRTVWLTVEVRDTGQVALSYRPDPSAPATAEWQGWLRGRGVEAAGTVIEGLPCSGPVSGANDAPSTLTGYFSSDARTFSAMEVRRYMGGEDGDLVYYLNWTARLP